MFYELRTNAKALRDAIRIVFTTKKKGDNIVLHWFNEAAEAYASMGLDNSREESRRYWLVTRTYDWRWN